MRPLPHDAIAQMCDAIGFDDAFAFKVELAILEVVEEADAATEEDGAYVQVDLVQKACHEILLGDGGGSDGNVSRADHGVGLREGALDAVGYVGPVGAGTDVLVGRAVGQQKRERPRTGDRLIR